MKSLTKETIITSKIMILGFVLIIAILYLRYKPVYEVKMQGKTLGYISKIEEFNEMVEKQIINQTGENIDSVSLEDELKYEQKLLSRTTNTDEENIIKELSENHTITTYKFYAVLLNEKSEAYIDTLQEAEEVVNQIKSEYDGNDLDLDLAIREVYTENKENVKTDSVETIENSVKNEVQEMINEKEAREAIASINGINIAVLPVTGTITSRFSDVSRIRSYVPHTGLDIACVLGTDIKAVAKGKVIYAGWSDTGLGYVVKIDHGNGIQTWYGHCSKLYVSTGDEVSAKSVIAAVGSTGNSTGPHLHFEVRINNIAVNPQIYLYK